VSGAMSVAGGRTVVVPRGGRRSASHGVVGEGVGSRASVGGRQSAQPAGRGRALDRLRVDAIRLVLAMRDEVLVPSAGARASWGADTLHAHKGVDLLYHLVMSTHTACYLFPDN